MISEHSQDQIAYEPTLWAKLFHSAPHVNITFHHVDNTFNPENDLYLESLGILASVPAGKTFDNVCTSGKEGAAMREAFVSICA